MTDSFDLSTPWNEAILKTRVNELEQQLAVSEANNDRLTTADESLRQQRDGFKRDWVREVELHGQTAVEAESMRQQLAAALAACKLKDEAISDFLKQYPHMTKGYVLDALAIQPDDFALREWLGEPVAWMITYDGKCMGFVPTEEANTVAVYSPKGLK